MSTIDPTSAINTMSINQASRKPQSNLDKDGFLQLLTAQLKNQDPQGSQDPTQYFQTITQMSVVEQLTNIAEATETQLKEQRAASATSMIGRTVTYKGKDGVPVSGTLESVQIGASSTTVTVDGVAGIDPTGLSEVK